MRLRLELSDNTRRADKRLAHLCEPVATAGTGIHRSALVEHEPDRGRRRLGHEADGRALRVRAVAARPAVVDALAVGGALVAVAALAARRGALQIARAV